MGSNVRRAVRGQWFEGVVKRAWLEGRPITDEPDGLKYSNYVEKTANAGVFVHPQQEHDDGDEGKPQRREPLHCQPRNHPSLWPDEHGRFHRQSRIRIRIRIS